MTALAITFWVWSVIVMMDEATNMLAPARGGEARAAALFVAGFGILHAVVSLVVYAFNFFVGMAYTVY